MSAKLKIRVTKRWRNNTGKYSDTFPIWELPADAESYDAMLEQVVRAADKKVRSNYWNIDCARAVLASIGIHRPTTKEKK